MLFFSRILDTNVENEEMFIQGQWSDKRNVYFPVIFKERIAYWMKTKQQQKREVSPFFLFHSDSGFLVVIVRAP